MEGLIIKIVSNDYTVLSNNKNYVCKARGKFRNLKITPLVGDKVLFDEKSKYIMDIKKRKNYLVRPPVANIDQAFIITSSKEPEFSSNLLDKLLVIIEFNNIKPIICFTKLDLLNQSELNLIENIINYYKKIGYEVYKNNELDLIKQTFKNKITVFTGQSGAGKSTLLNKIDSTLNIKTDIISHSLGRGKHTTRHVELLDILNGLVADTPGFSAITFNGMTKTDLRDNFIEFNVYKDKCQYRDCMHRNEENCNIKNNTEILKSRYENYLKFIEEK
ncbi:MAG: ribosome small subunit-dependent GTPase A [Bacilli bacterium]